MVLLVLYKSYSNIQKNPHLRKGFPIDTYHLLSLKRVSVPKFSIPNLL